MKTQIKNLLAGFAGSALLMASSCNKDKDTPVVPVEPNAVQPMTLLYMINNGSANPVEIQVSNRGGTSSIFNVNATGIYSVEFRGLNGRQMLQGNPRHAVTTNLADWDIGKDDTLRIKKNGVKYIDYIGDYDFNGGVYVTAKAGETAEQIKTRINAFTSSQMSTLKFNK